MFNSLRREERIVFVLSLLCMFSLGILVTLQMWRAERAIPFVETPQEQPQQNELQRRPAKEHSQSFSV